MARETKFQSQECENSLFFFFNWNIVKAMVFPVVIYRCVSWVPKNWWLQNVLEKTLENPLDCLEIKPVSSKENQSWFFIGRTDTEAEAPVLWPLDEKNQLIWKDPDAGKDWGQEEEGTTEGWDDWMASWTQWTWVWANSERWWNREAWCAAVHGVTESRTQLTEQQ